MTTHTTHTGQTFYVGFELHHHEAILLTLKNDEKFTKEVTSILEQAGITLDKFKDYLSLHKEASDNPGEKESKIGNKFESVTETIACKLDRQFMGFTFAHLGTDAYGVKRIRLGIEYDHIRIHFGTMYGDKVASDWRNPSGVIEAIQRAEKFCEDFAKKHDLKSEIMIYNIETK